MRIAELVDAGLAEIRTGPFGTQLHAADYVSTGRPVLNVRNVGFGEVRAENLEFVDEATAMRLSGHILRKGDIVFGRKGAVERHAFIQESFVGALQGSDCIRLRIFDDAPIRSRFVTFALRTPEHRSWMQSFCSHGATMASLNQDILRQIVLPDLDLRSQEGVIEILGAIDDLIDNSQRREALLGQMAHAIYREWFVNFRYPGHADLDLVDSPLGPVPEGWQVGTIDDVAVINGRSRSPAVGETIRYLDISCLGDRTITAPTVLAGENAPGRARRVVHRGDIVWSMVRPGRRAHALLVEPGDDWIASTGLAVLSSSQISTSLLFETVSATAFSDYLVSQEGGSAYPAVKPQDFGAGPILRPPAEVDRAFDDLVAPLHRLGWQLREASERLGEMRELLLPRLVTGQIDVSALDLDPLVTSVA